MFWTVVLLRAGARLRIIILMIRCADECDPHLPAFAALKSAALPWARTIRPPVADISLCSRIGSDIRTDVPEGCASTLGQCTGDLNDPTRWRSRRARCMPPRLPRYVCVHL